jgi:predicted RNA-binding protein with PIN domain
MPLLIDCYNLLHADMPPELAGLDTAGLCQLLGRSGWKKDGVTVVCDGRVGPLGLTESPVDGVELIYSGPNRSADDVIIDLIDAYSAPRRLTVVSSDRQIRKAARRRRASTWSSEEFVKKLAAVLRQRPAAEPRPGKPATGALDEYEVDWWLRRFGFDPGDQPREEKSDDDPWPPW